MIIRRPYQSHIFQLLFQQRKFEMNHLPIQWYIQLASVHPVVYHVQDNIIPNKHFQSVLHIDQYVSKDIHANISPGKESKTNYCTLKRVFDTYHDGRIRLVFRDPRERENEK